MFPSGPAGIALCLLRVCTIAGLALSLMHQVPGPNMWEYYFAVAGAAGLLFGLFTPIACFVPLVLEACSLQVSTAPWETLLHMLTALSLLLLGPGSYSVDAILFGRRKIVPPNG